MERTDHLFDRLAVRVKRFSLADFTFAKIGVLAFGLLIGSWLPRKVKKYRILLVLAFLFSTAYLALRFFFGDDEEEEENEDNDYSDAFEDDETYSFADVEPLAEHSYEADAADGVDAVEDALEDIVAEECLEQQPDPQDPQDKGQDEDVEMQPEEEPHQTPSVA